MGGCGVRRGVLTLLCICQARSKIRLLEGREKPVDILAKNILLMEDFFLKNDLVGRSYMW